jgi:hypothetical protein
MVMSFAAAQNWAPGIELETLVYEWEGQVPVTFSDSTGDSGGAADITDISVANDANFLYIRLDSATEFAPADLGSEAWGIDGDQSASTGFDIVGAGLGADTFILVEDAFGSTTSTLNNGAATPPNVGVQPEGAGFFSPGSFIEYAIPLDLLIPGDISQSFPGGLGSTVDLIWADHFSASTEVAGPFSYTLASDPGPLFAPVLDDMGLYDTTAHAASRTSGFPSVANRIGPAGAGDAAIEMAHTITSGQFNFRSQRSHRYARPRSIAGHTDITLDVFGDPAMNPTDQSLVVELIDLDFTRVSRLISPAEHSTAAWGTVSLGPTGTWTTVNAGNVGGLDLDNIATWRIGLADSGNGAAVTATIGYDNLLAPGTFPASLSLFSSD